MDLEPQQQGWQLPLLLVGPRRKSVALEQSSMGRLMKVMVTSSEVFTYTFPDLISEAGRVCTMMGFWGFPLFDLPVLCMACTAQSHGKQLGA